MCFFYAFDVFPRSSMLFFRFFHGFCHGFPLSSPYPVERIVQQTLFIQPWIKTAAQAELPRFWHEPWQSQPVKLGAPHLAVINTVQRVRNPSWEQTQVPQLVGRQPLLSPHWDPFCPPSSASFSLSQMTGMVGGTSGTWHTSGMA